MSVVRNYLPSNGFYCSFFKPYFCYIILCSLLNSTLIIQAVNFISHLASQRTHLKAVYFPYTGEELWAQLWWLPVESMSRSIFLCRWHQQGQLPASCYGCCSLGDCSQEHHSRLHKQGANANTQHDIHSWAIHRYTAHCACMQAHAVGYIHLMLKLLFRFYI